MNTKSLAALAAGLAVLIAPVFGQAPAPLANEPLQAIVQKIQQKLRAGENTASALSAEVAELEALRVKSGDATAAKIAQMQLSLYRDVLRDSTRAAELRALLVGKYRDHLSSPQLLMQLQQEEHRERARTAQLAAVGKTAPELSFAWSSQPGLKKLSDLKGKVVILDFWATWCGPCIATFPQVRELVQHYKDSDVVILGVTSLQGRVSGLEATPISTKGEPAKEYALTADFIKAKEMTWPVVFTEQQVFNPDYGVMGIPHLAIIGADGTVRHNGLHPGMAHAKKIELIDALLKEAGKTVPARTASE